MKTFGTVRFKKGAWFIDAEPHVMMRLKRVFAGISKRQQGTIRISATDENCADLAWFLERYPMDVDLPDRLMTAAKEYRERMSLVDSLLSRVVEPPAFDLAVPLREYQRIAAAVVLQTGSLLLADDVGLGKTASAIGIFSDPRTLPALVVTLTHLPRQWEAEVKRFAPKLRTHILKQATPYDITTLSGARGAQLGLPGTVPDVIITSYSKLANWSETLAKVVKSVVWDECVTADTRITMWPIGDGVSERIVDLRCGDRIAAFDENGNVVEDVVRGVTPKGERDVWRITLDDGRFIECTENERIMTEAGWTYAAEIINETSACDEGDAPPSTNGDGASGSAWMPTRGCQSGLLANAPSCQDGARRDSGGVLPPQSDGVEGLCPVDAETGSEPGLRNSILHVQHGDHARLRVLALGVHASRPRSLAEDGHNPMAGDVELGGRGLLVHGRRQRDQEVGWNQHTFVHRAGGEDAGGLAIGHGYPSSGRHREEVWQEGVLGSSIQGERGGPSHQQDQTVCSSVHVLQDDVRRPTHDGVSVLRNTDSGNTSGRWCDHGMLRESGLQACQGSSMEDREALVYRRVTRVQHIGTRHVFDVETVKHHTLFAGGIAVHNCQELRREGEPHKPSQKYSAAKHVSIRAAFRMGLSATPFYNYGDELRSVMNCIRPDALGTKTEFLDTWCVGFGNNKHKIKEPAAFGTYMREAALMLRRTRAEVGREIPPITRVPHHIDADVSAIEKAEDAAAELARIILTQGGRGFDKMQAAQDLDYRMRQATGVAKAPFVAEFVHLLVEAGEKVLLYGWHREFYSIVGARLAHEGVAPAYYTGTESATQKEEAKRKFVEEDTKVLIMSLRSGAGVDGLQKVCRTVVFGELDWSPGVHEQCVGRIARDGQPDPVVAYFLLADTGSDPIIADVLALKREQIEGVRDPDAEMVEKLEVDEGRIKRLAEGLLRQRGLPIPRAEEAQEAVA